MANPYEVLEYRLERVEHEQREMAKALARLALAQMKMHNAIQKILDALAALAGQVPVVTSLGMKAGEPR